MHQKENEPDVKEGPKKLTSKVCDLCSHQSPVFRRNSLFFGLMLCYHHLEILNNFEKGTSHFHFSLGPTYYIAGSKPGWEDIPSRCLEDGREIASRVFSQIMLTGLTWEVQVMNLPGLNFTSRKVKVGSKKTRKVYVV